MTIGNYAELMICINEAIRLSRSPYHRFTMYTFRLVVKAEYDLADLPPLRSCHRLLGKIDCVREIAQGVWEYQEPPVPAPVAPKPSLVSRVSRTLMGDRS